jgi:hypothetical protein
VSDDVPVVDRLDFEFIFDCLPIKRVNDARRERVMNGRLELEKLTRILRELKPLFKTLFSVATEMIGVKFDVLLFGEIQDLEARAHETLEFIVSVDFADSKESILWHERHFANTQNGLFTTACFDEIETNLLYETNHTESLRLRSPDRKYPRTCVERYTNRSTDGPEDGLTAKRNRIRT